MGDAFSVPFILSWCDITLKSMSKNGNKTFFYRKKRKCGIYQSVIAMVMLRLKCKDYND